MIKSMTNRAVQLAFGSAVAILLVVGALSYRSIVASRESSDWVQHTHAVLENLHDLQFAMECVASSIRGYSLTGDERYLDPYRIAKLGLAKYTAAVRDLTRDNPDQQRRIQILEKLATGRIARAEILIALRRTRGIEAAAETTRAGPGLQIMSEFQTVIGQMQDEERRLLALRNADTERSLSRTKIILIIGTILGLSIAVAAGWIAQRDKALVLLRKVHELNRSNEELGQFAYIASHDLQEPLRMVASYTQLLSRRYKGKLDADADEFIAFAVDGASRMQRLIQDLLTYSRVGTKGGELRHTSSEDAFEQALVNLRGSIEGSGAVVTHESLPTVLADEMQLTQLFQNLVGNAIKYQIPGIPRVHISAAMNREKKWNFAVKDNGIGIDPQYFERIFGMFQRLHKREEFAGTGIGLAICKKIVERHDSSISVESKLGHGSTFRLALARSKKKS
jgi:signal transduction histidine kinase